jgi:hypothetical protein
MLHLWILCAVKQLHYWLSKCLMVFCKLMLHADGLGSRSGAECLQAVTLYSFSNLFLQYQHVVS